MQLKPWHHPYKLGHQWPELLLQFTDAPEDEVAMDEPSLQFWRNVIFSKPELQIQDPEVLRLLHKESKANVLGVRYPCECPAVSPAALAYQPGQPAACALREKLDSFLPAHLYRRSHWLFTALQGSRAKAMPG